MALVSIELRARNDLEMRFRELGRIFGSEKARTMMRRAAILALAPVARTLEDKSRSKALTGRTARAVQTRVFVDRNGRMNAFVGWQHDTSGAFPTNSKKAGGRGYPPFAQLTIQEFGGKTRRYDKFGHLRETWAIHRVSVLSSFQNQWLRFLNSEARRVSGPRNTAGYRKSLGISAKARIRWDTSVNRFRDYKTGRFTTRP